MRKKYVCREIAAIIRHQTCREARRRAKFLLQVAQRWAGEDPISLRKCKNGGGIVLGLWSATARGDYLTPEEYRNCRRPNPPEESRDPIRRMLDQVGRTIQEAGYGKPERRDPDSIGEYTPPDDVDEEMGDDIPEETRSPVRAKRGSSRVRDPGADW